MPGISDGGSLNDGTEAALKNSNPKSEWVSKPKVATLSLTEVVISKGNYILGKHHRGALRFSSEATHNKSLGHLPNCYAKPIALVCIAKLDGTTEPSQAGELPLEQAGHGHADVGNPSCTLGKKQNNEQNLWKTTENLEK